MKGSEYISIRDASGGGAAVIDAGSEDYSSQNTHPFASVL